MKRKVHWANRKMFEFRLGVTLITIKSTKLFIHTTQLFSTILYSFWFSIVKNVKTHPKIFFFSERPVEETNRTIRRRNSARKIVKRQEENWNDRRNEKVSMGNRSSRNWLWKFDERQNKSQLGIVSLSKTIGNGRTENRKDFSKISIVAKFNDRFR